MGNSSPAAARKQAAIIEHTHIGPITHLRIRGTIDESFDPSKLVSTLLGHVLIDLGRVERISSFGVRKWMELTQNLPVGAFGLYLMHAPPVLVDQLNMVEGFAGIAQVLSVLAPYTCEKCGEERVRVIDTYKSTQALAEGRVPEFACPSCTSPMQFSDSPEEFFAYVREHPVPGVDPVVERYLGSLGGPRMAEQNNPIKIVQGDITYFRLGSAVRKDLSVRRLSAGMEGTVVYDCAGVASVDPAGAARLQEALKQAAGGAKVVVWRVPPLLAKALSGLEVPAEIAVANLWLPCECAGCGANLFQAVPAAEYLSAISTGGDHKRSCGVCGAAVQIQQVEGASALLSAHPATDVPYARIEAVEPKAASQLLHFASHDTSASGAGSNEAKTQAAGPNALIVGAVEAETEDLQLLKHLGRGGMAEVFLARQVGLKGFEKYVTVKRVLPHLAQSPEFVEMLFAEARANARLTHPNVVQLFSVGSIGGLAHLTMEYVRGPDLKRVLVMARKSGSPMPVAVALRILAETAAGLHYAHTFVDPLGNPHPVIHRDISPHNVLVSLDGAVKLSDFGIAKVNDGGEGTRPGTFKGKIHYASPEQIRGLPLDARHDLFSLGIVLYEVITGFLPFKGENDVATLTAIAQAPAPDPRQAIPGLPEDVLELMEKALAKDPEARFQTAGEFRQAIEETMMRNRYSASPVDVANYVRDLLGDRLKEFSPQSLAEQDANLRPPPSSPSALTPSPLTPSNFRRPQATPSASPSAGAAVERLPRSSGSGLTPKPAGAENGQAPTGVIARPKPTGLTPRHVPTGHTPVPSGVTPRPSTGGHTPVPSGVTPRPSASGHTPVPTGLTPRPSASGHTPVPTGLTPPQAIPGVTAASASGLQPPVSAAPDASAGVTAPAPAPSRWPLVAAGVGLVAVIAAGAALVLPLGGGAGVEVNGLRPGETLFIGGVEVNPLALVPPSDPGPVVVAVAASGELKRMGTARIGKVLDLQALFEAQGGGQKARLSVRTKEPGCAVELDQQPAASPTPLGVDIAAGKTIALKVSCEGKPAWEGRVMAVPGQSVEVDADAGPAAK